MRRYSEAFKRQVVQEVEGGRFKTMSEALRVYGIRGTYTIRDWLGKYGKNPLWRKVVRVETVKEIDERKVLRKENEGLQRAVSDLHMDLKLESVFLKIACERLNMSVEEFKKKHGKER